MSPVFVYTSVGPQSRTYCRIAAQCTSHQSSHLGFVPDHTEAVSGDIEDAAQRTPPLRLWTDSGGTGQTGYSEVRVKQLQMGYTAQRPLLQQWAQIGVTDQTGH